MNEELSSDEIKSDLVPVGYLARLPWESPQLSRTYRRLWFGIRPGRIAYCTRPYIVLGRMTKSSVNLETSYFLVTVYLRI